MVMQQWMTLIAAMLPFSQALMICPILVIYGDFLRLLCFLSGYMSNNDMLSVNLFLCQLLCQNRFDEQLM